MSQTSEASGSAQRRSQGQEQPHPPAHIEPRIRHTARMQVQNPVRINLGPINQPGVESDEEEEENSERTLSVASSRTARRSPLPPPSPPAPRPPPLQGQGLARGRNEEQVPNRDPYLAPHLPHHHPLHFGPRHEVNLHRPVFGLPPPPPLGMTREERDRVWDLAGGLRDARVRVRNQEIMMERAIGAMRRVDDDALMAIQGVRRVEEVIFILGCVLAVVCAVLAALIFRI